MLPALFVSHGSPTLPFDDCPARDFLRDLGSTMPKPDAVVVASAHWDTDAPAVTLVTRNDTIHDFYGFPDALYQLHYPAPGAPELAKDVHTRLSQNGFAVEIDHQRGLDHGAWVPLLLAYPDADIPVLQIAVQSHADVKHHIDLGRALAPLREQNVLILGSGGFVHNLRQLDWHNSTAIEPQWASDFASWIDRALITGAEEDLIEYRSRAPQSAMAHPTEEHFMPLFVAYGAGGPASKSRKLHQSTTFGSLRMDAYAFG